MPEKQNHSAPLTPLTPSTPSTPSTPLWTLGEAALALGVDVAASDDANLTLRGVSIDTRSLLEGELFIALAGDPGPRFFTSSVGERDGHDFLASAVAAGAGAAMVSRATDIKVPSLRVPDTLDGLWALGRSARNRHSGQRFAITGSSGKTTCKGFLAAALGVGVEAGSLNNFWGVPLCLARTPRDQGAAVFEIGTNQPGEIKPLAQLVQPSVAVLLNVHPAHIGHFRSIQDLQNEKLSINSSLDDFSNFVCEYSVAQSAGLEAQCITFGADSGADIRLRELAGDRATFDTPGGVRTARVPGGGAHRGLTLAAVLGALFAAKRELAPALELAAELVPVGRGNERLVERRNGQRLVLVDDSYNANPASMAAALADLSQRSGPRFAVLGDMGELGAASADYHLAVASQCSALDGVFCVGQEMQRTYDALPNALRLGRAERAAEVDLAALTEQLPDGARLLVKGSNAVFWQAGWCERLIEELTR